MIDKDQKIRLVDIADKAGVSIATVSRYLHGVHIREDASKRISLVLQKMGVSSIEGNKIGLSYFSNDQLIVGMVVPDITHNYCSKIVAGAMAEAKEHGQHILLESSESSRAKEREILKSLAKLKLGGLIYMPVASWEGFVPDEISLFDDIPVVVVGRRNVLKNRVHIYPDNITGGYIATKYLLNLKRRRIVFCIGIWEYPFGAVDPKKLIEDQSKLGGFASLDRFVGYLRALEEYGIDYDPALVTVVPWDFEGGKKATADILGKTHDFDSFIATSDTMASGVIESLKLHGYSIPAEVSVMGWDNSELCYFTEPHLTSVEQPSVMMGRSASRIIHVLEKGEKVQDAIFDVFISPKESTALGK